jgi:hypothetical protein
MSRNKATGEEENTMLFTPEAIRAEDKYRREALRDQNQTQPKGRARTAVVALVVAGAIALAACGIPAETAPEVSAILADNGPSWAPDFGALTPSAAAPALELGIMAAPVGPPMLIPVPEYGPMPAPGSWQSIPTFVLSAHLEADADSVNNTEPFGHPNYGRLQTYLGVQSVPGPR